LNPEFKENELLLFEGAINHSTSQESINFS
jgi:hypothetical protein